MSSQDPDILLKDSFLARPLEFPARCDHDHKLHLHVYRQVFVTILFINAKLSFPIPNNLFVQQVHLNE